MLIKYNKIVLRDITKQDIEDYIKWDTTDREWQNWDAPWLKEETSKEKAAEISKLLSEKYIQAALYDELTNSVRKRFEICVNNYKQTHISWMSRYYIDGDFQHKQEENMWQ